MQQFGNNINELQGCRQSDYKPVSMLILVLFSLILQYDSDLSFNKIPIVGYSNLKKAQ